MAVFAFRPIDCMPLHWEDDTNFPDDHEWPDYFHMPVLMLMLITALNDGTLIGLSVLCLPANKSKSDNYSKLLNIITTIIQFNLCIVLLVYS